MIKSISDEQNRLSVTMTNKIHIQEEEEMLKKKIYLNYTVTCVDRKS